MVKLASATALAAAIVTSGVGCFEDRYRCASDADCDLGAAPRCDDGFCTAFDPTCATQRRYGDHAGERAAACFAGQVAIDNPCAGGQPAAIPDGCAAAVCDALPACCDVGWSDACAQQAELRCDLRCDTRLAVTAKASDRTVHLELTWDGATWTARERTDRAGLIAWIAPPPGGVTPRLAGLSVDQQAILIGARRIPVPAGRTYQAITSVDFDRSGRDTIATSYDEDRQSVDLIDVDTGATRTLFTDVGLHLAWGDSDRDGFPDGIAGRGSAYTLLRNIDGADHVRAIEATQTANVNGGGTPGAQALRDLAWIDLTGDGRLDLVAFGNQIKVHADEGALRDAPLIAIDCDPLAVNGTAPCNAMAETSAASYAGAPVPGLAGPTLAVARFTDPALGGERAVFRIAIDPDRKAFAAEPVGDSCPTCPPIVALFARDLDGDHVLDLIGLDTELGLWTARGDGPLVREPVDAHPGSLFTALFTSVTGAAIP